MSRPEHLNVPNTAAGIRRINELQELYDKDPEAYERKEQQDEEEMQLEQRRLREDFEMEMARLDEIEQRDSL